MHWFRPGDKDRASVRLPVFVRRIGIFKKSVQVFPVSVKELFLANAPPKMMFHIKYVRFILTITL